LDRSALNTFLARYTSLPRSQVKRSLIDFSAVIEHSDVILDLGCGRDKPYQRLFRSQHYFGIDLYEPADILGDIASLPFPNRCCDAILCTEVLEHVPDPGRVLSEINRVLKPGKHLILTVPLLWGEHEVVDYQRWTEAGLRKLLGEYGFQVEKLNRRGGLFSSIGCMAAQIPLQVFGGFQKRNILCRLLFLVSAFLVLPIPWIFSLFDGLDRGKKFTLGYAVLCQKKA
jgi:SAM-dependent methyltransferase